MMLGAYISGVGILGPGLADWPQAAAVLAGRSPYVPARTLLPAPTLLPPAERRRTGRVVKLALAVALEAATHAAIEPAQMASVFSSSGGDGHNCHELCAALALEGREISPTRFSNSVHNAAAGYWSIATGAKLESNVLCAFDASFCAGLLEAVTQVVVDGESLMLVTYDTEYPDPIHAKRPVPDALGIALVLTPRRCGNSLARIAVHCGEEDLTPLADPALDSLRRSIPAARGLPLLALLAAGTAGRVSLEYLDATCILVDVDPCS